METGSSPPTGVGHGGLDHAIETGDALVQPAVELARSWVGEAMPGAGRRRSGPAARLAALLRDDDGFSFVVTFLDRVVRAEHDEVAARHLAAVVRDAGRPGFLSPLDRALLRAGAALGPRVPQVVMPAARRRLRHLVGHLVVDATPAGIDRHLGRASRAGVDLNLNVLGEAVLGEAEARRRRDATSALLDRADVDYVSVKVSSVVSQLDPWDHAGNVERVMTALRPLLRKALAHDPPAFVNLDVEEYRDLDLTIDVFGRLLDEDEFLRLSAGIALQAYLPDAGQHLPRLLRWADRRRRRGGAEIRVRLVKGANLAMERVTAEIRGWPQAPYTSKADTDANYKRLLDEALHPDRLRATRIGLASHNLFDLAWGLLLAEARGVGGRVDVEMLHGMAPDSVRTVRRHAGRVRLYSPVVAPGEFDAALAYLVRRLEETAAPGSFLRWLHDAGPTGFEQETERFRAAVAGRHAVPIQPRHRQDRALPASGGNVATFANEPDTDPALAANRRWAAGLAARPPTAPRTPMTTDPGIVDEVVARARTAGHRWARVPAAERQRMLNAVADQLARRRGELVATMMTEAGKPIGEGDPEVSEAIDFARYYGERARDLERVPGARFDPAEVVAVVPPWNFPVAIPAGGVLAALAAGSAAVLKPAPETPRCAEVVAEACWDAGVDHDLVAFLRVPDDHVGRHLITHPGVDVVILTGAFATARQFRRWHPGLRLLGETSGKNSLVITPSADVDLAVTDLVRSAFGHGGQKCSAASLAILVGEMAESRRFRRQLVDAVQSLRVGVATDLGSRLGPLIRPPEGPLAHALTELDPGERWLVEPRLLDASGRLWSPGVKDDVAPGASFHLTECFGPVLGLMRAPDLDAALELQRAPGFGLTGGIHSLDDDEVAHWLEHVEVGNAYVNRHITGSIVRRQPFGGWHRSVIGPGAKTGGPNYLGQFGTWWDEPAGVAGLDGRPPTGRPAGVLSALHGRLAAAEYERLRRAAASDELWWHQHVAVEHDPTGLKVESNVLRYRSHPQIVVRATGTTTDRDLVRAALAALRTDAEVEVSVPTPTRLDDVFPQVVVETDAALAARLRGCSGAGLRIVGEGPPVVVAAADDAGVRVVDGPVVTTGRVELLRYVREQSVSRTRHRYGQVLRSHRP